MDDKQEILVAITELKVKNEHLENYIYEELKPDIEKLCKRVETCTKSAAECYSKNLKWMIATLITSIIAISSLVAVIMVAM